MIHIKKGLKLPITGEPKSEVEKKEVRTVALTGPNYVGMKPSMQVKVGDTVKIGQPLFSCKKNVGLVFTSPAAGKVSAINRGDRRAFETMEIDVSSQESHQPIKSLKGKSPEAYDFDSLKALLLETGEFTSLRQRPFDKVADVTAKPNSLFITAIDTHPLSPDPSLIIKERQDDFNTGVMALSLLAENKTYVCVGDEASFEVPTGNNIEKSVFKGIHPAGNVGTHIHFLDPVNPGKVVWHIGYQDVIAIGHLITNGKIDTERTISLAGPYAQNPRLIKTRKGASIEELISGETQAGFRAISGSVFHGRKLEGAFKYLGHYANQISLIEEDTKREFLGWHSPGLDRFSVKNIYLSKLMPGKLFNFGSSTHGSLRAMVPIGSFEKVMPLDILPTQLLRALVSKDTDSAQDLGCLELAEEDIALLTFVAPGKVDFGPILRENLTIIEKEG